MLQKTIGTACTAVRTLVGAICATTLIFLLTACRIDSPNMPALLPRSRPVQRFPILPSPRCIMGIILSLRTTATAATLNCRLFTALAISVSQKLVKLSGRPRSQVKVPIFRTKIKNHIGRVQPSTVRPCLNSGNRMLVKYSSKRCRHLSAFFQRT